MTQFFILVSGILILQVAMTEELSLSKLKPAPTSSAEPPRVIENGVRVERVDVDNIPFIKLSSKDGAIYLPNLKRDELSAKRLEQAQCAANLNGNVVHPTGVGRVEANLTEQIKPYTALVVDTIHSKCDNNSDRNRNNTPMSPPRPEIGVTYQPKVKKPGDELESYKVFTSPLYGPLFGVGKSF